MEIPFYKYHGAGNDFVIIDIRDKSYPIDTALINRMCHRRFGIGADGVMLLGRSENPDCGFSMRYFNADGPEGTMCGNGGRCIAAFAHFLGIENMHFSAIDGLHQAQVIESKGSFCQIRLQMKDVEEVSPYKEGIFYANTGSPHLMVYVKDLENYSVDEQGKFWRYHPHFPGGLNVNFVEIKAPGKIAVRTYERGVEAETWACGTGATASAITSAKINENQITRWEVAMKGGLLKVDFEPCKEGYKQVFLTGPTQQVFSGIWQSPYGL